MSPLEGEDPLSLWFALTPAVIGILIALYLLYKIFVAHRLGKKVNAQRPDPKAFDDYPELQAMVDRFYILRYQARVELDSKTLSAKEIDEGVQQLDDLIEEGLSQVITLRDAETPEEIGNARAAITRITQTLEARAGV
ncbi:MAG: hypothetical protein VYE40_00050 [Myxococcota bacterium]|nr:hypothetical protein [Myxococcota bacterium]